MFLSKKRRKIVWIFQVSKAHGWSKPSYPAAAKLTPAYSLHLPAAPATVASSSVNFHHKELSACVMV